MSRPAGRALVTGAARRLGRAMALGLAARGHDVAVHFGSSSDDAEATARALRDAGVRAVTLSADLLDEDQAAALVPRAAEALGGPLTLLVNNASTFDYDNFRTASRHTWERNIGTNLRAPFLLTQAFAAQVPEAGRQGGRGEGAAEARALIVNMLDQRVRKLTPEFASYTIAKMGLLALTETSARALAPHVRVNAIAPGSTLQGAHQSRAQFDAQRSASILERGAEPSDIVAALDYLIDARAVTGQVIVVDGGQHLGWKTPDILGST